MSKYRPVLCLIWDDEKFFKSSDDCQIVWFHVFTSKHSTPLGLINASVEGLAADKNRNGCWSFERYQKAFTECIALEFIKYDQDAHLILFPKFFRVKHKQNYPANPNVLTHWGKIYNDLPESPLKHECFYALQAIVKDLKKGFPKAFKESFNEPLLFGLPNGMPIQEQRTGTENREQESPPESPPATPDWIIEHWNKLPGVTPVKAIMPGRGLHKLLTTRLREYPRQAWWIVLLDKIASSDFLCGRKSGNKGAFNAALDWCLGPENLAKIIQGNYDNKGSMNVGGTASKEEKGEYDHLYKT